MKNIYKYLTSIIFVAHTPFIGVAYASSDNQEYKKTWNFDVYRSDAKVGTHEFVKTVAQSSNDIYIESKADFDIPYLLFFTYEYEHSAKETWGNNCLIKLESNTDRNGNYSELKGEQIKDNFKLTIDNKEQIIESDCISSFAYWDKNILAKSSYLLNPANGKYEEYSFKLSQADVDFSVKNNTVKAMEYILSNNENNITLWYLIDTGEWVGLDAKLEDGSTISYRLN